MRELELMRALRISAFLGATGDANGRGRSERGGRWLTIIMLGALGRYGKRRAAPLARFRNAALGASWGHGEGASVGVGVGVGVTGGGSLAGAAIRGNPLK